VYVDEPSSVWICEIDPCQRFLIVSERDVPPSPQKPSGRRMNTSETVGFPESVKSGIGCPLMPASAVVHELATPAMFA
jgi:hypothetical protein